MLKQVTSDIAALGGLPLYLMASFLFLFTGRHGAFYVLMIGLVLAYASCFAIRFVWFKQRPDGQQQRRPEPFNRSEDGPDQIHY